MAQININMDSLKPRREWKRHKLKEGVSTLRVLPPFGEKAEGYPYKKWIVVWGLTDPSTGKMRPFASPIISENRCPVYEYLEIIKKKIEEDKNTLKAQGYTDQQIKDRFQEINKVVGGLRPRKTFAYNATDKSGTVGILEITSTAHKQLIALMHGYVQDYGQDPTSLNSEQDDSGVWFNFGRTGTGLDTEYKVEKAQTKKNIDGQLVFVDDRDALPQNIINDYENLGYDLFTTYKEKSYNEMKELLLFNLKEIVKKEPYFAVPGFDNFEGVSAVTQTAQQQTTTTQTAPGVTKGNPANIKTKFDIEDDTDLATPTAQAAPTVNLQSNDDILAAADDILNDI